MIFYYAAILESGEIVEQERFESGTFDRNAVGHYFDLIKKGEDFGEDLADAHLEFSGTGPNSATVEISSEKGDVITHLLGSTSPAAATEELKNVFTTVHNPGEPVGEGFKIQTRPLALVLLPDGTAGARALARYSIVLAAAFFEEMST